MTVPQPQAFWRKLLAAAPCCARLLGMATMAVIPLLTVVAVLPHRWTVRFLDRLPLP